MIRRLLDEGVAALSARQLKWFLNVYPPYLGAGVRIVYAADDYSRWEVEMRLTRYNRNYFGTHFGGSLYSMCDPFFLLILAKTLGREYIVWDKEAKIRFRRPGRGTVRAVFEIPKSRIDEIIVTVDRKRKLEPTFSVDVQDEEGNVVAEIEKRIYIRKKGPYSVDQFGG